MPGFTVRHTSKRTASQESHPLRNTLASLPHRPAAWLTHPRRTAAAPGTEGRHAVVGQRHQHQEHPGRLASRRKSLHK